MHDEGVLATRPWYASYTFSLAMARGVMVLLGIIGAMQVANADLLGLTPRFLEWLKILAVALGMTAGFLPRVTANPRSARAGMD